MFVSVCVYVFREVYNVCDGIYVTLHLNTHTAREHKSQVIFVVANPIQIVLFSLDGLTI